MSTPPNNNSKSPGSGIDTGTGGFPVGQNSDLYTYNVGGEETDYPRQPWSSGQINVDKEVKDLSKRTKTTLASYLSETTLGKTPSAPSAVKNKYAVSHSSSEEPRNFSLNDDKGYPAATDNILQGYSEKFATPDALESRSKADTNLRIKRGRQEGELPDGNDLLTGVSPLRPPASSIGGKFIPEITTISVPENSVVGQYYGRPNLSNSVIYNRFNPEGNDYQTRGAQLNSDQFAKKYSLGTSQADRDMSFGRLAQVGSILSSRASVELDSLDPNYNPSQSAGSAALPGLAQLGLTNIDRTEFEARNVIEELTEESIPEGTLISVGSQSWGTLNNVNDQFGSISNFGMQLLAVALLVSLSVVILAMTALFSLGSSPTLILTTDQYGRNPLGASSFESTTSGLSVGKVLFSLWRSIGIQPTKNPLNKCIPTGALSFFGMNVTEITSAGVALEAASNGLAAVSQSPGYYAILGRMIGRSFLQISEAFSALGSAFNVGLFATATQVANVVATIRQSKFIRFINIFGRLGDQILDDVEEDGRSGEEIGQGFGKRFRSRLDDLSTNDVHRGRIMRTDPSKVNPLTLSWASYRAPDLFIVPEGLRNVVNNGPAKSMGVHPVYPTIPENTPGGYKSSPKVESGAAENPGYTPTSMAARIPTESREMLEKHLDSEYVPFYIHDVRTNEIVSFHAFLASLSDSYSAAYDTAEAFGRVEAIKIYKSTNRKIDFSFYIAATNSKDFDSMWLKINKLTTLLYPQFTEGRTISDGSRNNIYMPFSQTIQAAPMVRIRIGDLITSNYSRFNLARIFGYTYSGTKFDGTSSTDDDPAPLQRVFDEKLKELRGRPGATFRFVGKSLDSPAPMGQDPAKPTPKSYTPVKIPLSSNLVLKVVKRKEGKEGIVTCEIALPEGLDRQQMGLTDASIGELKESFGNDKKPTTNVLGKFYDIAETDMDPTPSTHKKIEQETTSRYSSAVDNFMQDRGDQTMGNAVARSFRSSGGKGLAGFIESMSFDWYDKVTWVTDEGAGRKAPKMCKVTIQFTPIHDITPGLDHMGANRAPVYTVKSTR